MPMIDLTFVRGSVDDQALNRLADELVTVLLRAERAPDTPFLRDNTWVYLHPIEAGEFSVGGRGPGAPRFRVDLTVFEGALDRQRKERLAADVHGAVYDKYERLKEKRAALTMWERHVGKLVRP